MSDTKDVKVQVGPGFFGTLTIVFVIMKILGYIDWSWYLVFAPVLIPLGIIFGVLGIAMFVWLLISLLVVIDEFASKKKK
jgi:hypothetical protein